MQSNRLNFASIAALAAAVSMAFPLAAAMKERVVQTNSAGDDVHIIDPTTNKVVGEVDGIEVPHGTVISPNGKYIWVTEEANNSVDAIDGMTLKIVKKIKLSGHPNNLGVSKDSKKVYVGIAQAPGAVDVIDTATLTNIKSIPVKGAIHNVYVTPDGKFAVSGSVQTGIISVIDTTTDTVSWTVQENSGIRPMLFTTNPDGSTKEIIVQLSNYHGLVGINFATHEEARRVDQPDIPGQERETDGIQGAPAHGLAMTPDQKILWTTSKFYSYVAAYSYPDLKLIKIVKVGGHPEWLTIPPDGKALYVGCAGTDSVNVVDNKTMEVVANIPVGFVPKRNGSGMLDTK
jgi:YVTN family beta-propeller protein